MTRLLWLVAVALLVAGSLLMTSCASDPFGWTTREQIRADSALAVAKEQTHARIETTRLETAVQREVAQTWAGTLPLLAVIIVGGVLAGMVIHVRGKAYLMLLSRTGPPALPSWELERQLTTLARTTGRELVQRKGDYYLVDQATGTQVRVRPKGNPGRPAA